MAFKQSDSFNQNRFFWKLFGLWPGKTANKYYKYFSFTYLLITLILYNILLTLNVYYTPRKIDLLIPEVIFLFTEIVVSAKASMIIFKRKKLLAVFDLLNCEEFQGYDDTGRNIVKRYNTNYKIYLTINTIFSHSTFVTIVFLPVISFLFFTENLDFPICQYYFLSDETKSDYFVYIFIYQSIGIYGHTLYNVNIDSLIVGFMLLAIAQVKVLDHNLQNLKIEKDDACRKEEVERTQLEKLHKCVKHHELVLKYCDEIQDLISSTMFVQCGVGSANICVCMCALLLPLPVEMMVFMVGYLFAINLEIFLPAWLGTQLSYESQDLMVAVYKSDWIPRPERYKSSVRLFVERAKRPIVLTGLKMFPLALSTYISIIKAAYSCFTLVRFFLDRQEYA